jgi:hypothetical protein
MSGCEGSTNQGGFIMRSFFGLLVIILSAITIAHASGSEENIAPEAEVEASSIFADKYVGDNVIDGNNDVMDGTTRWLSSQDQELPIWLTLDFGRQVTISKVILYFHCQHTDLGIQCWGPVEYVLQYEKDSQWVDIPGTQVEDGNREDNPKEFEISPSIGAQRLRFYCTDACSYDTSFGNIIRMTEIEVYADETPSAISKAGKLTTTWGKIKL